jgi:hypothetical protein
VACECDQNKVACIRHFPTMCRCPPTKKFMLGKHYYYVASLYDFFLEIQSIHLRIFVAMLVDAFLYLAFIHQSPIQSFVFRIFLYYHRYIRMGVQREADGCETGG